MNWQDSGGPTQEAMSGPLLMYVVSIASLPLPPSPGVGVCHIRARRGDRCVTDIITFFFAPPIDIRVRVIYLIVKLHKN